MKITKPFYLSAVFALALTGCSSTQGLTGLSKLKPITNVDHIKPKKEALAEKDLQRWSHLDILRDSVPGMSVDRAYEEILKGKKGKKVIVGVIDSGIEIDHEDLKEAIWTNLKEVNGNKVDDDNNGYVDDIHGWGFLGASNEENMEFVRIVKRGDDGSETYKRAKAELEKELEETNAQKEQMAVLFNAKDKLSAYLNKDMFDTKDLEGIGKNAPKDVIEAAEVLKPIVSRGALDRLNDFKKHIEGKLNYHLNVNFDGRKVVGDDPFDINDKFYGNNDVLGARDHAKHGTHVAGIIAQKRHNNKGGDGVASDVAEIMAIRAVPDGDEYDKDVALAIRYAVDNGAKVINGSFGKYFSTNSEWVYDAIKYAASKDVLIVVAAGNDALDINVPGGLERYPNDTKNIENGKEIADNFLVVGALNPVFGEGMVANFTNIGQKDVDVYAPGVKIYATVPYGKYEYLQGTSMASPNVAGVATLIRSYYPNLTAAQVKKIIMDSGVPVNQDVIVRGEKSDKRPFKNISVSGKFVNAYNALLMADKISKKK